MDKKRQEEYAPNCFCALRAIKVFKANRRGTLVYRIQKNNEGGGENGMEGGEMEEWNVKGEYIWCCVAHECKFQMKDTVLQKQMAPVYQSQDIRQFLRKTHVNN